MGGSSSTTGKPHFLSAWNGPLSLLSCFSKCTSIFQVSGQKSYPSRCLIWLLPPVWAPSILVRPFPQAQNFGWVQASGTGQMLSEHTGALPEEEDVIERRPERCEGISKGEGGGGLCLGASERKAGPGGWRWLGDLGREVLGRGPGERGPERAYLEPQIQNLQLVWPQWWSRARAQSSLSEGHALPTPPHPIPSSITTSDVSSGARTRHGAGCPAGGGFPFFPQLGFPAGPP